MKVRYLNADRIVSINKAELGVGSQLRDPAGLEGAVARAWSGFGDEEFFPSLWSKAAVLLQGLATTQFFKDGNKRTAWLACNVMLEANGEALDKVDVDEAEAFVLDIVVNHTPVDVIASWLYQHAAPLVQALDDEGVCLMCGFDGPLPGAEFFPRDALRELGLQTDPTYMLEYEDAKGEAPSTFYFRFDRDLVPGVCERCTRGWLRLVDARGLAVFGSLADAADTIRSLPAAERRSLAAWCTKLALLSAVVHKIPNLGDLRRHAEPLRTRQIPGPGWCTLGATLRPFGFNAGALSYSVRDVGIDNVYDMPLETLQHTFMMGDVGLTTFYDNPLNGPIEPVPSSPVPWRDDMRQLWPTFGPASWPPTHAMPYDHFAQLGMIMKDSVAAAFKEQQAAKEHPEDV